MSTNEITIEKGIPLPPTKPVGNRFGWWVNIIRRMEVGDSIVVPANRLPSIYQTCKRNGWKIQTQKQPLKPGQKIASLRLWLVGKATP